MDSDDLRKLDYEKTIQYAHQLSDTRFKLLAVLPIATGAALGLAKPVEDPLSGLFLGFLGFFVTLGLVFYDQRNTEIYEKQMHRARLLELKLNFPPVSSDDAAGGPVGGRPEKNRKLFGKVLMWHDRGLAFIYSAVLAVWIYLISASTVALIPSVHEIFCVIIPLAAAVIVASVSWDQLHKLDNAKSEEIKQLEKEIGRHQESLLGSKDS